MQISSFPQEPRVFFLETCQRYIWIFSGESWGQSPFQLASYFENAEIFHGKEAYLFLLRVATGLESEVIGETDIFGQLKEAWKKVELTQRDLLSDLGSWMQKLFEDTKEIRSRFLQKLGGSSYGTLVRRLIRDLDQSVDGQRPILLVGAGQIAQSIAPFLLENELWLWNRNPAHLCSLHQELSLKSASIKKLISRESEEEGWRNAAHVVVCIPLNLEMDRIRMEWFRQGGIQNRSLIHLGGLRDQCGEWSNFPRFFSLDDLFKLQSSLGGIRTVQVAQAIKACEERAQLRSLGASLSIPHGWEDLACFA
jgi:hypothetical protein